MKNIYLWNKSIYSGIVVPTLWFSAKTYYEENGSHTNEWAWHDPYIHEKSFEHVLELCAINPPNLFGFSLYIWSHIEANKLAQEIKRRYPKCLIVYGGPQIDIKYSNNFFTSHPWVDLVVPSDVYGEPIIQHILDNFDSLKHQDIPEVYYHKGGIKFKSQHDFVKRSFKWPTNIFKNNQDHFDFDKTNSLAIYETTRGCPYKCTYCDWGGGTFTKVVKKPLDTIYSEIETLCKNKIENFFIADANFGIYKEDVSIAQHIVAMKNKYGYPLSVTVENAKNNLARVIEIQRILMENKLVFWYKISVQNSNDEIKKNIDRVDIPFEDYLKEILKLKQEYDAPVMVETILGLPGDSYARTLESIDLYHRSTVDIFRSAIWNLLPEAPAYDPVHRKKFDIKTKWFEIYTHSFRYKPSALVDAGVVTISNSDSMYVENVISTYSYSKYEWCDMFAVSMLSSMASTVGLNFLTEFLDREYNIGPGAVYDVLYKEIIVNKQFTDPILNEKLSKLPENLYELVDNPDVLKLEFDIDENFPLYLAPHVYVAFIIMLYPQDFFTTVTKHFADKLQDNRLHDLGLFLTNIMIDLDYNPTQQRRFVTTHNWYSYIINHKPLINSSFEYIIVDKLLKFTGTNSVEYSDYPDTNDIYQKIKQFFYHRASNPARIKYASNIVERELNG